MTVKTLLRTLIVANRFDLPTDRVCQQLAARHVPYFRINREDVTQLALTIDPINAILDIGFAAESRTVNSSLSSVYWRQPTFERTALGRPEPEADQLERTQWSAFLRGLMLFENSKWINHPAATYAAEVKPFQLRRAHELGFDVPATRVTNDPLARVPQELGEPFAIKSVDTLLLRQGDLQTFGYTSLVRWEDCADTNFHLVPTTCQAALEPKLDLRVTVIGNRLWCDAITVDDTGTTGDWRLHERSRLHFADYELPAVVAEKCVELVRSLKLSYGAIDLAISNGRYWFIEINPTGEWGWLDRPGRGIGDAIAAELAS